MTKKTLRRNWWRLPKVLLLAVTILLSTGIAVLADPALPDSPPTLPHIYVNRSVIEADDFILVAEYDIPYAGWAGMDAADVNYIFELIEDDGTTKIGSALPYPFSAFNNGYNLGATAFYFPALTAPTWGENYIIRIITNPVKFSTTTSYSITVPSPAYTSLLSTDQTGNQAELCSRMRVIISDLQTEYGVDLVSSQDTGNQLTSDGESYFREAIPGLQAMAPILFFVQNITYDTSTRAWGTTQSDTYKTRLAGADGIIGTADDNWILKSFSGIADWVNIPTTLIMGIIVVVICVILISLSVRRFGTPIAGYVGSLLVVMCGGMLTMGLTLVAIITFALILMGGWFIFMRHA